MLGRFPSRTVIFVCLLVAVGSLFLRNIVYIGHSQPHLTIKAEQREETTTPIILAYHERAPYYITGSDHQLSGLIGKIAISAFQRSGIPFTLKKIPPTRQLKIAQSNHERICALGWFRTPEREAFGRFTLPLYQDLPISVIGRSDIVSLTQNPSLIELFTRKDLTLLTQNGYSYGSYIDSALRKHTPAIVTTSGNATQMLEMIASKKADYFFAASEEADDAIAASQHPEQFKVILPSDVPQGNMRYLLCSQQVTLEEIERINSAITAVKNTGEGTAVLAQ